MLGVLKAILGWISQGFGWIVEFVLWCVVKLFLMLGDALLYVLELVPVPDWLTAAGTNLGLVPGDVWYFLEPFHFGTGLSWMLGALLLRFMIRRLPVIG